MSQSFYFAIPVHSVCVDGMTYLRFESDPLDIEKIDSLVKHIKLTFKHLPASAVEEIVDNAVQQNQTMLMAKMLVEVPEPPIELDRLPHSALKETQSYLAKERDRVFSELDKRFPREE